MGSTDFSIRLATPEDIPSLPEIERRAALLYKDFPDDLGIPPVLYDQPTSLETLTAAQQQGHLWVATTDHGELVGFALAKVLDAFMHLEELDVLPAYGRRGIGSALLAAVCRSASDAGCAAVSLRTFRDVPWNRAFYERRGFRVVGADLLPDRLRHFEAIEQAKGLRTDNRVTMTRPTIG